MLTRQNGILNRATEAKEKTDVAQKDEHKKIQGYEDIINQYVGNLPSSEETKPYLPNSTFSYKEGDLNSGLVIKDADGNEYVWVEVPKTLDVYKTAGVQISNFTDEKYIKIEEDLKEYTKDYKSLSHSDASTVQYKNMLKSIYTNGGFWVGRYEAGIEEGKNPRTSYMALADNDKLVVKSNMYPYNYVKRDEAQILAERMNYGECISSLMFGIQWDLVLRYIEEKTVDATKEENKITVRMNIKNKLTSNSTTIGNYYNSEFTLNRGKFAQYNALSNWFDYNSENNTELVTGSKKKSQKLDLNAILLTTGATDATNLQNIFDIAGNVWEWTLELGGENYPFVSRGGSYNFDGENIVATNRDNNSNSNYNNNLGFRIGLWK